MPSAKPSFLSVALNLVEGTEPYKQARRRGGQRGASAPPAFHLGEQGGGKAPCLKM